MWVFTKGERQMLTKDDEESALKIALHTELQWQKLQIRMQADKAKNTEPKSDELFKKFASAWKPIYEWLNWKPLTLGAGYTVVVVTATVFLMPALNVEELLPKDFPKQNNNCSSGYFPRIESEAEKEALRMKQQFESSGATVSYQKINSKAFFLEILPPNTPSQELLKLWDDENINAVLSPNCPVSFIFIAPE